MVTLRTSALVFGLLTLCVLDGSAALAQSPSEYGRCVAQAEQQSGYYETGTNPTKNAPLKGAAAGAAGGALLGGITGGSAGTGAAIGAAFGAIAGGVRQHKASSAKQNAENAFYNDLNNCLNRPQ
jgi:outer membrane lipoprotein SlyB